MGGFGLFLLPGGRPLRASGLARLVLGVQPPARARRPAQAPQQVPEEALQRQEIRSLFPGTGSYPAGATPSRPLSINHLLGPSFIDGALQVFGFVTMNPYSELFLRCSTLATAADIKGPLGNDIICKCIINAGLGFVMSTRTDEGHFVKLHGPITWRALRFKLTDVDGNVVNTRGTSVSLAIFLDYDN